MYRHFLYLLLVLLSFNLSSCEYKNYYSNNDCQIVKWRKNKRYLSDIGDYEIFGCVVCSFYDQQKARAQFFFQNIDSKYSRLVLTDFIGFKIVEITILENGKYSIHKNIKNHIFSSDFENLFKKLIKEDILLKNFQKWMIGLPGTVVNFNLNTNGLLKKMNYPYHTKNFVISYKSYYDNGVSMLPKVIEICYNKDIYININIYKWVVR